MRILSQKMQDIFKMPQRPAPLFTLWLARRDSSEGDGSWFSAHHYLSAISEVKLCFEIERGRAGVGSLVAGLCGRIGDEEESLGDFLASAVGGVEAVLVGSYVGVPVDAPLTGGRGEGVVLFSGISTSIEKHTSAGAERYLLHLVGAAKAWEEEDSAKAFSTAFGEVSPPDFTPFADLADTLMRQAKISHREIDSPKIETDEPFWDYYPVPRMGMVGKEWDQGERPQAFAWDEKRGIFYFGVDDHLLSFNAGTNRWDFLTTIQGYEAYEQTRIVHLQYDPAGDRLLGCARNTGVDIATHRANAHGHFIIDNLDCVPTTTSCMDVYHLYDKGVKVKGKRLFFANAVPEENQLRQVVEAIGAVSPCWDKEHGMGFCHPIIFVEHNIGSVFYVGTKYVRIDSEDLSKFRVGDWVQVATKMVVGDEVYPIKVSDVGPITRIDESESRIYFEELRGLKHGIPAHTIYFVYVVRQPDFTPNIFIPHRMTVRVEYDPDSYERRAPLEVFRRNELEGAPDDYIACKIGEITEDSGMELDVGFYAFRSLLPFGDDGRHNPNPCPFWLTLEEKVCLQELPSADAFVCNHPQMLSEGEGFSGAGEDFCHWDLDVLENILRIGDEEVLTAYAPVYLSHHGEHVYAAINGFEREDNRGISGIYRKARLVEIDPASARVTKELWVDEDGVYEFCAKVLKSDGDFHLSLRRIRENYVNLNLRIVGVEYPKEETDSEPGDVPEGYFASNRQSARIYFLGDVSDRLSGGDRLRVSPFGDELLVAGEGQPLPRDYVVSEVATLYVEGKNLALLDEPYSGYLTTCFLVGIQAKVQWGMIHRWAQDHPGELFPPTMTEDEWRDYLDLLYMGDDIKRKLQDWLEDELLGKTIWKRQGYLADGGRWMKLSGDETQNLIWECSADTGEVEEGRELLDTQVGERGTVRYLEEGESLPVVPLTHGDLLSGSLRLYLGFSEFVVEEVGAEPVRSSPGVGRAYLAVDRGEEFDQAWLYFDSRYLGEEFRFTYRYYHSSLYIDHFLSFGGCVYALEQGSGRWLRYDREEVVDLGKLMVGQEGARQLLLAEGGCPHAIISPAGNLARFAPQGTGYLPRVELDGGVYSSLCALAKSADMVVFAPSPTYGIVANRRSRIGSSALPVYDVERLCLLEEERYRCGLRVRVDYPRGRVERGAGAELLVVEVPFTASKALAEWLAERFHSALLSGRHHRAEMPIDYRVELLDEVCLSTSDGRRVTLVVSGIIYDIRRGMMTMEGYQLEGEGRGQL